MHVLSKTQILLSKLFQVCAENLLYTAAVSDLTLL